MIEDFKRWLDGKIGEYDYMGIQDCPCFRFLKDSGYPVSHVGGSEWWDTDQECHPLERQLSDALVSRPRTYESLRERLTSAQS